MTIQKYFILILAFTLCSTSIVAQNDQEDDYRTVANDRARKIVEKLDLVDGAKRHRLQDIIANQYIGLNAIHTDQEAQLAALRDATSDKEAFEKAKADVDSKTADEITALHEHFLNALSQEIDSATIDQVKDGITYGVLPITYRSYVEMLPTLTGVQKQHIYGLLVEARETAMDKGSSTEKHAVFGRYKGKINNYLSAEGVETKEARRVWEAKLKAREKSR